MKQAQEKPGAAASGRLLVAAVGAHVGIELGTVGGDMALTIREAWRDAATEGPEPSVVVEPHVEGDASWMLSALSQAVTMAAIEARKGELWLLHAGGVALPDGRVVVFVGPSGRGKTTLAHSLGTVFGYVSDETVGIDDEGRVWPYRKPLSIIEDPARPKVQRAASSLDLLPLPDVELRVAAIVLLDRHERSCDEPVVELVDLGDALVELVEQSSYLASMPAPLRSIARIVARAGGVQRVTYRDAETIQALIPRLVSGSEAAATEPSMPVLAGAGEEPTLPSYFRGTPLDAIALEDPDRIAVLQVDDEGRGVVRVLAGIAPALWRAASGVSFDALVAAAVAQYGAPSGDDPGGLVRAAVAELRAAGVLELRTPE